jgi:multiple sugar transport system ATP-binding protein
MTLGDRIVIMRDGWIMQIGTPQDVFDHPANVFVAGFIGMPQMNFFNAELVKTADGYQVVCNGATVALSQEIQDGLKAKGYDSKKIILGCRPEHMVVKAAGADTMEATVDVSEMMGSEIHLHVTCGGVDTVIRVPSTELSKEQRGGLPIGAKINLALPDNLVHLFDPETEENLL